MIATNQYRQRSLMPSGVEVSTAASRASISRSEKTSGMRRPARGLSSISAGLAAQIPLSRRKPKKDLTALKALAAVRGLSPASCRWMK